MKIINFQKESVKRGREIALSGRKAYIIIEGAGGRFKDSYLMPVEYAQDDNYVKQDILSKYEILHTIDFEYRVQMPKDLR